MNKLTISGMELVRSAVLFILCICATGFVMSMLERDAELDARLDHNRKSIELDRSAWDQRQKTRDRPHHLFVLTNPPPRHQTL